MSVDPVADSHEGVMGRRCRSATTDTPPETMRLRFAAPFLTAASPAVQQAELMKPRPGGREERRATRTTAWTSCRRRGPTVDGSSAGAPAVRAVHAGTAPRALSAVHEAQPLAREAGAPADAPGAQRVTGRRRLGSGRARRAFPAGAEPDGGRLPHVLSPILDTLKGPTSKPSCRARSRGPRASSPTSVRRPAVVTASAAAVTTSATAATSRRKAPGRRSAVRANSSAAPPIPRPRALPLTSDRHASH